MQTKAHSVRWKVEKATGGGRSLVPPVWTEVLDSQGAPRVAYESLLGRLQSLPPNELRGLDERLEATMRELGVSFDLARDRPFSQQKPWFCDLLPHVFRAEEWQLVVRGVRQRLRAFEMFLHDLHGSREILRREAIPIAPVLGSPAFQKPAVGLRPPRDFYLHVGALCLKRNADGQLEVSSHHFAQANGISCMVQNRRVLARVAPELFQDQAIASIADTPTAILETLREAATDLTDFGEGADEPLPQPGLVGDPLIVLLSPGPGSPFYPEHGFLARRMGVPLVQGGDLLVLDDRVYLKTISGLERVHVIYNRVEDSVLDPLVLERGPGHGVPGLVHCLRQRTVALVNGLGAQLADDRALLAFAPRIIRFYLNEKPLLPTLATYWLGDLDQREMVLNELEAYRILPLHGDRLLGSRRGALPTPAEQVAVRQEIRRAPHLYVAQPINQGAETICFERGRPVRRRQDHLLFALRRGLDFDVFPGALTRIAPEGSLFPAAGLGGGSKDTWVLPMHEGVPLSVSGHDNGHAAAAAEAHAHALASETRPRRRHELRPIPRRVTSRSAESLYWLGRYLERANHLAYIINTVETLETEELNAAERKLYKPMWNRLLPHLDASPRRSMSSPCDRYRLVLEPDEPGALVNVLRRALNNADSIQDTLSPEAWGALSGLRGTFARQPFFQSTPEAVCAKVTRKLSDLATRSIAQFYGLAESSMLEDDGWRFCVLGQQIERAIITSNAVLACFRAFVSEPALHHHPSAGQGNGNGSGNGNGKSSRAPTAHDLEIELSAFLRLLGTRDAYRRVYQIRAEPLPILQLLFQHPAAPRSVLRCLRKCAAALRASGTGDPTSVTQRPLAAVDAMGERLLRTDWSRFFEATAPAPSDALNAGEIALAVLKTLRTNAATATAPSAASNEEEPRHGLQRELTDLLRGTMNLHDVIADCFLNHQAQLSSPPQPHLPGFPHGF